MSKYPPYIWSNNYPISLTTTLCSAWKYGVESLGLSTQILCCRHIENLLKDLSHRFSCNMIFVLSAGALCSVCKEAFKSRTQPEFERRILTLNALFIDDFDLVWCIFGSPVNHDKYINTFVSSRTGTLQSCLNAVHSALAEVTGELQRWTWDRLQVSNRLAFAWKWCGPWHFLFSCPKKSYQKVLCATGSQRSRHWPQVRSKGLKASKELWA